MAKPTKGVNPFAKKGSKEKEEMPQGKGKGKAPAGGKKGGKC